MKSIRNVVCLCAILMTCMFTACSSSSDKIQVEVWHNWNVEEGTGYELTVLADEYNKSQDKVEVLLVSQPSDGFSNKVYTSVANGTGPDIFFNFANSIPEYAAEGLLADMGKYMDTATLQSRISEALWNESTGADGKLHVVPIQTSAPVLFYNKTLYDELGLDAPKTWSDLESDAEIIYQKKGIPGFASADAVDIAQMLFCQTGAEYIDATNKTVGFNTPACAQQLNWYTACVNKGIFTTNFESGSVDKDFNAGLLACFMGSCTYEPHIIPEGFEYAAAPAPTDGEHMWAPIFSRGAIVFASNEETEAAACEFLEFITLPHNTVRWSMGVGSLSPYNDAKQSADYSNYVDTDIVLRAAADTIDYAYTTPAVIGALTVRSEVKQLFLQVVGGSKTAEEALAEAEVNCNKALQN